MDLRQLEYLLAAIKSESYSVAAKELFVTPQAISKAIISLEKEMKHALMMRNGNSMRPTEFALEFLPEIEDVVGRYHALEQALLARKDAPSYDQIKKKTDI